MSDSFDSVFGAMPAQASSHSPVDDLQATFTMKSPPPSSCSPSGAGARLLSAAEVKAWASRGGRQGNMRALLSSLHEVLWEDSGWTPVSLADLVDQAKVREAYRKAVTVVHPDKVTGKDRQDVAQVVFTCLRESYDIFKKEMAAAKVSLAPAGTSRAITWEQSIIVGQEFLAFHQQLFEHHDPNHKPSPRTLQKEFTAANIYTEMTRAETRQQLAKNSDETKMATKKRLDTISQHKHSTRLEGVDKEIQLQRKLEIALQENAAMKKELEKAGHKWPK
eukprot:m51a1_g3365 putative dnaj heat shock n-terminal domain-containing protein (277) ;mRNA; f:446744-448726